MKTYVYHQIEWPSRYEFTSSYPRLRPRSNEGMKFNDVSYFSKQKMPITQSNFFIAPI